MKAIIIEEERFKEICTLLDYEAKQLISRETDMVKQAAIDAAHRSFHYHFVSWAQSHGASCV